MLAILRHPIEIRRWCILVDRILEMYHDINDVTKQMKFEMNKHVFDAERDFKRICVDFDNFSVH